MTLAMIVRADGGGLGAQTWELWRHLRPARTLVVLADHKTRGAADPSRYTGDVRIARQFPTRQDIAWLTHQATTVYTIETWYGPRPQGVRTVLHGNPEMGVEAADLLLAATDYRLDLFPGPPLLLPMPVARDRLTPRPDRPARTLYHVASNAFHDRNGTELVLAACRLMTEPCRLLIRNPQGRVGHQQLGAVDVGWIGHHHGPYHEAWPGIVDALVLPRRFAGLCLPMQEAAALNLPIITLDVTPQRTWLPAEALVPATVATQVRMKGGLIDVHTCDPQDLADRLDRLVTDDQHAKRLRVASDEWAETISWPNLIDRYLETLT